MAQLYIGTCSWKYPSWQGLVYSAAKGIDYLAEYARRYNTVEIDQWFWSRFNLQEPVLPNPEVVAAYRAAVENDFRFTVKAPNSITLTHLYREEKKDPLVANPSFLSVSLMEAFLERLAPLHDVLGPIMFQFEYLNQDKVASQEQFQEQFAEFAGRLPSGFRYGVEVRNPAYLSSDYIAFLQELGLSPVLVQGYWMPPIWQVYDRHRELWQEQNTVIIRLLGPERKGIEELSGKKWDRIVAPKDQELDHIAEVSNDLVDAGADVYINVNNHYEGSAPLTIERLRERL